MEKQQIVDEFHKLFYSSGDWGTSILWAGIPVQKCPLDLWIYQEILHEIKPDLIIETGTCFGGSALFMAHICDIIGKGQIVTVDNVERSPSAIHPRITRIQGSSLDMEVVGMITEMARPLKTVMVILDADHHEEFVLHELWRYANLVTPNSYLIVEDTNINGHPVAENFGRGPAEAVDGFLTQRPEFQRDLSRERFMMTQNPGGYLKRIR